MAARLINEETGEAINIGDKVTTSRGELFTLKSFTVPHKISSSGRVTITRPCTHTEDDHERIYWCRGEEIGDFFPNVIGAKIVVDECTCPHANATTQTPLGPDMHTPSCAVNAN